MKAFTWFFNNHNGRILLPCAFNVLAMSEASFYTFGAVCPSYAIGFDQRSKIDAPHFSFLFFVFTHAPES